MDTWVPAPACCHVTQAHGQRGVSWGDGEYRLWLFKTKQGLVMLRRLHVGGAQGHNCSCVWTRRREEGALSSAARQRAHTLLLVSGHLGTRLHEQASWTTGTWRGDGAGFCGLWDDRTTGGRTAQSGSQETRKQDRKDSVRSWVPLRALGQL